MLSENDDYQIECNRPIYFMYCVVGFWNHHIKYIVSYNDIIDKLSYENKIILDFSLN